MQGAPEPAYQQIRLRPAFYELRLLYIDNIWQLKSIASPSPTKEPKTPIPGSATRASQQQDTTIPETFQQQDTPIPGASQHADTPIPGASQQPDTLIPGASQQQETPIPEASQQPKMTRTVASEQSLRKSHVGKMLRNKQNKQAKTLNDPQTALTTHKPDGRQSPMPRQVSSSIDFNRTPHLSPFAKKSTSKESMQSESRVGKRPKPLQIQLHPQHHQRKFNSSGADLIFLDS